MKQDVVLPDTNKTVMIRKNDFEYFEDLRWAFFNKKPIMHQNIDKIK